MGVEGCSRVLSLSGVCSRVEVAVIPHYRNFLLDTVAIIQ